MFCPNCGTQNPDTAQTCSKCNFNIKGAAAPKFKGTMLMMNQPPVPGAPPPAASPPAASPPGAPPLGGGPPGPMGGAMGAIGAPRPAGGVGAAPPPGASGVPSKLKGTMVGVAPMAGGPPGAPRPQHAAPVTAQAPMMASPLPPAPAPAMPMAGPGMPPPQEMSSSFSPPVPQPGVNPLGGTVAADAGAFGPPFPGAPPPFGAPPGGGPPGAPPQFPPYGGGGGPPNPYGGHAPPPGMPYGAPPPQAAWGPPPQQQPYGAPPQQQGWGPPPQQQPYGAPPGGAMTPYAQGGAPLVGTLPSQGVKSVGPTRRNPVMTLLLPFAIIFGSILLGTILAIAISPIFALLDLGALAGSVWFLLTAIRMANEVKFVTQNQAFAWWPIFVPFYNYFWLWILVPQEVAKAKQMLGVQQPPRSIVLYILLWPFALASDINDMVR
ncbi:MAG TPA: zinc-ribbon domain-containing protein [Polyangiaceae bacterium]|nr:zinc-ribbon domain-containing protein [Polyangiaceae bacterium]